MIHLACTHKRTPCNNHNCPATRVSDRSADAISRSFQETFWPHTHTQLFNGLLSGTTQVGQYEKKHSSSHTHPDHQTSFIIFLHLQRSKASSLFSLRAWQSSRTTSLHVLFGLPLGLGPSTSCISSPNHHLFTAHAHTNAACFAAIPMLCHLVSLSTPDKGPLIGCVYVCILLLLNNLRGHLHGTDILDMVLRTATVFSFCFTVDMYLSMFSWNVLWIVSQYDVQDHGTTEGCDEEEAETMRPFHCRQPAVSFYVLESAMTTTFTENSPLLMTAYQPAIARVCHCKTREVNMSQHVT